MRMFESRLKRLIRSVIRESRDERVMIDSEGLSDGLSSNDRIRVEVNVGDMVHVLRVNSPYSSDRQSWAGCEGIVGSIEGEYCTIIDPQCDLKPLTNQNMYMDYIELVEKV
jgi:hypothetical protein